MTDQLNFGHGDRLNAGDRKLLRVTRDCVDMIGMPVAEGVTGARRQDLTDAFAGRASRYTRPRWHWGIALLSSEEMRAAVAAALVEPLGYGIAPLRPLTDAERLARLEYRVATQFGPAGLAIVEGNRR